MRRVRSLIRETIGLLLRFSGIAWAIRSVFLKNRVTILVYHQPEPKVFKKHMEYLSKRYEFISLDRLVDAIRNGDSSAIPPKALVVTCDDGHSANYELLETLKAFDIRPTIFVCSHIVKTNRHFWWQRVDNSHARAIKRLPIDVALEKLRREHGYDATKEYPQRQALCESEMLEMMPHVNFGSHTKFHPILPQCQDGRCLEEIGGSKESLDVLLNKPVEHFAYPNGDYGEREVEYVRACGYRSARTLDVGWNNADSDPYRLKAIGVEDDASINILSGQLTGMFSYLKYLWHGSFRGRRPRFL
jgi:peptidoglycan/xylan/chitin deacetylase (PgdA/CDA1 family)